MTHPLAALIADVPHYEVSPVFGEKENPDGIWLRRADVLAALEAATPPDLTDSVTVHANMLRGTIAKPTVDQIIHLYGREAFQPMIDAAVAKALEDACLAVSEHADWPEDEHGRTERAGLFARVINAICAIAPAAPHVNETPKSEHDAGNVLTVPDLVEAGKVLEGVTPGPWVVGDRDADTINVNGLDGYVLFEIANVDPHSMPDARFIAWCREGVPALIALATAQAAQIAGLSDELHTMKTAGVIEVAVRNPSVSDYMRHWEARAEAAEAKVAELEAQIADLEAGPTGSERYRACIPQGYQPAQMRKYEARHHTVIRGVMEEMAGTRAADLVAWLVWWNCLDSQRFEFLQEYQKETAEAEAATLRAEVERLRGALDAIYEITVEPAETDHKNVRGWIEVSARAALEGET